MFLQTAPIIYSGVQLEATTILAQGGIDIHQTVEKLYSSEQVKENTQDLKSRLKKIIASELRKLQKRLDRIEQERARQQEFEQYRQIGDLLLANLHQLKRGTTEASLLDYYQQPPAEVLVTLNPLLNPQENAEKYFQKSKKAKRGLEHSSRRKTETTAEVEWLSELDYQLSEAQDPADITLIADELATAGLLKEKSSKLPRRPAEKPKPYQEMKSPNGFRILWGNNSRQNDALSTKELKKGDLWFHAHRCHGSHVVLKAESGVRGFTDEDVHLAASVAAANSRAKNDLKVEVMRVEACYVKKPAGAKPGMVTVKQYKTLMVEPFREESELF